MISVKQCSIHVSRAEYKVEKRIQTDYTFISTSLFRGCPLVRRFNKKYTLPSLIYNLIYIIIVVMKLNLIYACQLLRKRALFLWRQEDTSSLRLLSVDRSGWQMIRKFSLRHKFHLFTGAVTRKDNNKKDTYIGLTENTFKTRYRNHTASFRHAKLRNSTELSKHIWTLKDNCIDHFISLAHSFVTLTI